MKGQTQALTGVMITAVTVGAVATAYIWGTPLLEKRQGKAEIDQVEADVLNLRDEIVSVSRSGSGTSSSVKLGVSDGRVEVNEKKDFIEVYASGPTTAYAPESWNLIKGSSLQNLTIGSGSYGLKDQELPATVAVKTAPGAGDSVLTYRIETRNLKTETPSGSNLEKIDLVATGRKRSSGETTLQISNVGQEQDTVKTENGEELERQKTLVEVDIQ